MEKMIKIYFQCFVENLNYTKFNNKERHYVIFNKIITLGYVNCDELQIKS